MHEMLPIQETGKGTYILILYLAEVTSIKVGRLGTYSFAAGWYAYVGSAFGAGGLGGRINRHLKRSKPSHWHIDYLREQAVMITAWYSVHEQPDDEHVWALILSEMPQAQLPVPRFGASDCTCPAHLYYFPEYPERERFNSRLQQKLNR